MRLAYQAAARQANISIRTLRKYRAEGLTVEETGGRVFVELEHVLAWKRWKSLSNRGHRLRRESQARSGVADARVSDRQRLAAERDWIAAGGQL